MIKGYYTLLNSNTKFRKCPLKYFKLFLQRSSLTEYSPYLTTLRSVGDTKYFSIRSLRKSPAKESKTTTKSNKFQGSAK